MSAAVGVLFATVLLFLALESLGLTILKYAVAVAGAVAIAALLAFYAVTTLRYTSSLMAEPRAIRRGMSRLQDFGGMRFLVSTILVVVVFGCLIVLQLRARG